jgi:hypothetical protein
LNSGVQQFEQVGEREDPFYAFGFGPGELAVEQERAYARGLRSSDVGLQRVAHEERLFGLAS